MRLLFLQYAGDYREAVQRFARGGSENYYAQKYSVDTVASLTQYFEEVSVLVCLTEHPYNEILENGVRGIGAGFHDRVDEEAIIKLIEAQQPTHLILATPMRKVLRWAIKNQIKVLPLLAESIVIKNWRDRLRASRLISLLNHPQIDWVGSYGLAAAKQLQSIGVNPEKIIPWDFLIADTPGSYQPKVMQYRPDPWQLIYVGSLSEAKGVGDVFRAVAQLCRQQFPVQLKVVGSDSEGIFARLAAELNISEVVEFLGMIPNQDVVPRMRAADAVLVPSRHEYTEGFPLTIHHALCSRTPIIASDHPMFQEHLKHGINAVLFPASNEKALATAIEQLFTNPALYAALSQESYDTWYRLRLPVKCGDLITRWVESSAPNAQWLYDNRFTVSKSPAKHPQTGSPLKMPVATK